MTPANLQNCLRVLSDMVELELALAELYEACNAAYPGDGDFWLAIKRQEEGHAEGIRRIAALVAEQPGAFEAGRPFNSIAINNIRKAVAEHAGRIRRNEVPRERALVIARDIENSVLEAKYDEFVKTRNVEYMTVIDRLSKETFAHRDLFDRQMGRPAQAVRPRGAPGAA